MTRDGAALIAVSAEPRVESVVAATERGIPFPLLSDPERVVIAEYGLAHDDPAAEHPVSRPATFIIDAAGLVRYGHIGEHTRDRPTIDTILLALESLKPERGGYSGLRCG